MNQISAGTKFTNIAGTETEIPVQVKISAGTGTEPNFGRSLPKIDALIEKASDICQVLEIEFGMVNYSSSSSLLIKK